MNYNDIANSLKLDTDAEEVQEVFEYLNELMESGSTNMLGADTYIADEFEMDIRSARQFLSSWMEEF